MKYPFLCIFLFCISLDIFPQEKHKDSIQPSIDSSSSDLSFGAEAYSYFFPDDANITILTGYVDYKSIHMEARYNYEDLNTASVFGGYRFEAGKKINFGFTPMLGAVFGNTNGIAPGILIEILWKKMDFYSETEYVYDFAKKEYNFLYTWSELAITPFTNFRTGLSANRTRLFQSDLDLQRGVFAEYIIWKMTAGIHYFNPFTEDNFLIAAISIDF